MNLDAIVRKAKQKVREKQRMALNIKNTLTVSNKETDHKEGGLTIILFEECDNMSSSEAPC